MQNKKDVTHRLRLNFEVGRGGEIRTHGLLYPKQARYQTAPRPDLFANISATYCIVNHFQKNVNTFLKIICLTLGYDADAGNTEGFFNSGQTFALNISAVQLAFGNQKNTAAVVVDIMHLAD